MAMRKPSVASLIKPEKAGYLVKQGGLVRNWKKRWFVLKGEDLWYFKTKSDSEPAGKVKLGPNSSAADGFAKTGQRDSLEIVGEDRTYFVYSDDATSSRKEILEWRDAINAAIQRGKQKQSVSGAAAGGAALKRTTWVVRGLWCECCESTVQKALATLKGVQEVMVDLEEEQVTVVGQVSTEAVVGCLEIAGFLPVPVA
ncbi:polar growth protein [Balamuthia mandrillaris]